MTVPSKGRQWKRCGIYCIYAKYGHVARYVDYFLSKLVKSLDQLVIVANGELDADSRKRLERFADRIIVRENKGLDIAAYRQALLSIGWSKLAAYDEVICLNDTILGPVFPFSEMFETMDGKNVDFWGITAYPHDVAFGEEIPTHLQSYWHAYRKSLITSKAFQRYWETMPVYEDYAEATRKHEMTFTKRFADLGFTWASYIDYDKYRSRSTYPMLYDPVSLIRDDRCPVFKKRSFFVEYQYYFNQTAGQPGMELLEYLRRHTDYDTDLIWDAVLPAYNIADIAKAVHLNYVLPTRTVNPREDGDAPVRSAFIYHVYFLDLLDQTLGYLANLPEDTALYITTNESKIDDIRKAMDKRGFTHTVDFIPVQNRGRDVSALLVGAKDVVLGGKYDVVGFARDKKSGQNQQIGHQGTETEGFAYKLLENTLGSKDYVRNILTLFANNPRLGMATPPPPIHALYFAHTVPHDWGINFDITKDLLENKLVLIVPKGSQTSIKTFEDLADSSVKKVALGEPKAVPVGQYSEGVFQKLGILDKIKKKANYGSDVRQVLAWVESGEVDCGVVYMTDAKLSKKVKVVCGAPKEAADPVIYPVAVLKDSRHQKEAQKFADYLKTDEILKLFESYGFQRIK